MKGKRIDIQNITIREKIRVINTKYKSRKKPQSMNVTYCLVGFESPNFIIGEYIDIRPVTRPQSVRQEYQVRPRVFIAETNGRSDDPLRRRPRTDRQQTPPPTTRCTETNRWSDWVRKTVPSNRYKDLSYLHTFKRTPDPNLITF